jgi:hypothetical protein
MCMIYAHAKGVQAVPEKYVRADWTVNNDGAGYCFARDGKLVVRKPYFKLKHLVRDFYADHAMYGKDSGFVLHLRFATHGEKDEANTHPFLTDSGVAVAHNGILWTGGAHAARGESDTAFFVRTVLAKREASELMSDDMGKFLSDVIGIGNKLAMLDSQGALRVVNDDMGEWDKGVWYSTPHKWRDWNSWKGGSRKADCKQDCSLVPMRDLQATLDDEHDAWGMNDIKWDEWLRQNGYDSETAFWRQLSAEDAERKQREAAIKAKALP